MSDYENSPNHDPKLDKDLTDFIDENPWFNSDPVLREAAIELDSRLHLEGVPSGKARFRHVEDRLREAYADRFYDVPDRKLAWSDIADPVERRGAKQGYERIKGKFPKMSEADYLKDYLNR